MLSMYTEYQLESEPLTIKVEFNIFDEFFWSRKFRTLKTKKKNKEEWTNLLQKITKLCAHFRNIYIYLVTE